MPDKTPRKKDPAYHVFLLRANADAATPPQAVSFEHLTPQPVKAANRTAAIQQALSDLGWGDEHQGAAYMVIQASEYQLIRHRVETQKVDLWEPMPPDPSALSVPPRAPAATGSGAEPSADNPGGKP
jgi:hypothetical protein